MTETIETLNSIVDRKIEEIGDFKDWMSPESKNELKGFWNCLRWISSKIGSDD